MDPLRCLKSVTEIIGILSSLVQEHRIQNAKLWNGLDEIKEELDMIDGDMENYNELKLRELAYEIEDFVQSLWVPGVSGPVLSAFASNPVPVYLEKINNFRNRIQNLEKRQQKNSVSVSGNGSSSKGDTSGAGPSSSAVISFPHTPVAELVGIADSQKKLLELLEPADGQDPADKLKVISIVGCPGVGKTALSRAVFEHYGGSRGYFHCIAWVEASECKNKSALLDKILERVQADLAREASASPDGSNGDGTATSPNLHGLLAGKRYLIFVDDVRQANLWNDIVRAFPENSNSSKLIVTTSVHSVANAFSSGSYVYRMQCLRQTESEDLFWTKVFGCKNKRPGTGSALLNGSNSIISKCDGFPLALISVGKHLNMNWKDIEGTDLLKVGNELYSHYLAGTKAEEEFRDLRRALGQCYENLPDYDHKICMLSLCIFPRKYPIKSKSLVRRLIAEGFVASDGKECLDDLIKVIEHGKDCVKGLVDRYIVEPEQICSFSKDIKSCRVNGIMLEFIIHKSQSKNLITLIREGEVVHNNDASIRRLSIQFSTKDKVFSTKNKVDDVANKKGMFDTVRSLTIIPSDNKGELFKIRNCKFLRLLDLEGCRGLDDQELFPGICDLVYLKYLSLRKTDVKKIPQEIENLLCLQTLDIRETRKIQLPIQVILLPKLAFLFGEFVLPEMTDRTREFLSTKSELHTLAGFVVNKGQGFEQIILEARKLRKVEVWCRDSCAPPKPETSTTRAFVSELKMLVSPCLCVNASKPKATTRQSRNNADVPSSTHAPSPTNQLSDLDPSPASASDPAPSTSLNDNMSLETSNNDFIVSLQEHFTTLDSLSIHSSQLSQEILASLQKEPCKISCLKLWGKLSRLPGIATLNKVNTLNKLQLSYTGCTIEDLSILQYIPCLEYLKLQDNKRGSWGGTLIVHKDGFESLRRLCFQAAKLPKLLFEMETMKRLSSLHLLCRDISQMQVAEDIKRSISHITCLSEVILHYSAAEEIVKAWEKAANGNENRPCVKRQQKQ